MHAGFRYEVRIGQVGVGKGKRHTAHENPGLGLLASPGLGFAFPLLESPVESVVPKGIADRACVHKRVSYHAPSLRPGCLASQTHSHHIEELSCTIPYLEELH